MAAPGPAGGPSRRGFASGALAAALSPAACAAQGGGAASAAAPPPLARSAPLELPPDSPFEPLGALLLSAGEPAFRGLSGLHLGPDWRLAAVADTGRWLTAAVALDAAGRPAGLADLRSGPLRDAAGAVARLKRDADAEALARLPDGTWLVAFERRHRVLAYRSGLDGAAVELELPPEVRDLRANGGLEAVCALPDGRLLLIAEGELGAPAPRPAWIGRPAAWTPLRYRRSGFAVSPVDAAALPGTGDVLVLERGLFSGRLVRVPAAALAAPVPGATLAGEVVLRIEAPMPVDNYEGLACARIGGRTVVALVSDDNGRPHLQSAWLLLLALAEG